jgi:ribosomal protein L40E
VSERCSCGAVLPEAARFCHKCGKPQLDEDIARLNSEEKPAPLVVTPALAATVAVSRIGFNNIQAVLITLAVAALSLVVLCVAFVLAPPLGPIVLCAAGYVAAKFYKGRNPGSLSTGGGAFLGMMTGLWLFLVMAISSAIMAFYVSSPEGREALSHIAAMQKLPDAAKLLGDPHLFIVSMVQGLVPTFFIATISAAFGGMLGARSSARERRPS